ncbi:hypothetical protein [Candidatus Epulonipiscium viviparus]|uniref:hypothetical protein n=1 Tax=Candidatus Epulonipiscium viviparus TaxID=420336 RepID=UPI00016BFC69|nr:hypothetical protein [Candidatus Epulopiscium viviparus]
MSEGKNQGPVSIRDAVKNGNNGEPVEKKSVAEKFSENLEKTLGKKSTALFLATAILGVMITVIYEKPENDALLGTESFAQQSSPIVGEVLSKNVKEPQDTYAVQIEKQLEDILKNIQGLGSVEVMVTLKTSSEKILAEDVNLRKNTVSEMDSQGGTSTVTEEDEINNVIMSGSSPYVIREDMPQIEGVLVVAGGGDNIGVKNAVIEAVSSLLDIPVHKVSVFKMENK